MNDLGAYRVETMTDVENFKAMPRQAILEQIIEPALAALLRNFKPGPDGVVMLQLTASNLPQSYLDSLPKGE